MTELTERSIPEVIGDLIQQLEQSSRAYAKALTGLQEVQQQMQGLDVAARLVEAAASLAEQREALESPKAPPAETDFLPGLLAGVGARLVDIINERAAALTGSDPAIEAQRRAEVAGFRANRFDRLRSDIALQVDPLFATLQYQEEAAPLGHVLHRYRDLMGAMDRFAAQLKDLEEGHVHHWDGRVDLPVPDVAEWVEVYEAGPKKVLQLRPEAVTGFLAELNRAIETNLSAGLSETVQDDNPIERLERTFLNLLEQILDLRHSLRQVVEEQAAAGRPLPKPADELLRVLRSLLKANQLEEMDISPGKALNTRLHRAAGYESKPGFKTNEIIRVITPGYYYRDGDLPERKASVVVST